MRFVLPRPGVKFDFSVAWEEVEVLGLGDVLRPGSGGLPGNGGFPAISSPRAFALILLTLEFVVGLFAG